MIFHHGPFIPKSFRGATIDASIFDLDVSLQMYATYKLMIDLCYVCINILKERDDTNTLWKNFES